MVLYIGGSLVVVSVILLVLGQYTFWSALGTSVMKDEIPAWVSYLMYLLLPVIAAAFSVMGMTMEVSPSFGDILRIAMLVISGVVLLINFVATIDVLREVRLEKLRP